MNENESNPKKVSAPIRMSPELAEKVAEAGRMTGLAQADILRLALAIGLEDLRKVNFDLPRLVSDAARPDLGRPKVVDFKVAESASPAAAKAGYWIDLRGGVAAGSPITGDVVAEPVPCLKEWPEDHYALRVFGASMQPKVPDGALIIVREWPASKGTPRKGTIVVYADGHGATLKEFGYRKAKAGEEADSMGNVPVLRSINPAFPDVQVMDGGRIEAVMVEVA